MPSTPTTKSQVQAYRFVLRRMQSALVRKDAVMLHDPMRSHSRATIVGICIAALGVIGFLVYGLLKPAPKVPNEAGIVIAQPSGAVYVLLTDTPRGKVLVPTFNLASARLLMLARSGGGQDQERGSQTDAGTGTQQLKAPEVIPDAKLVDIPRERLTGIQDGPQLLPDANQRISADWAVCDETIIDADLNDQAQERELKTTVIGGVAQLGTELAEREALLVKADDGQHHLIYRVPSSANFKNANTVRAKVDVTVNAVKSALKLDTADARRISTGLLNAIPEAPELASPALAGRGDTPKFETGRLGLQEASIGTVFEVERVGGPSEFYVIQADGIESVKASTGQLILTASTQGDADRIELVNPDDRAEMKDVDLIDDRNSPDVVPEVLKPRTAQVACLGWGLVGDAANADQQTKVYVGQTVPVPVVNGQPVHVRLSSPNADGQRLDYFYMPPGRAAVVRGSSSKEDFRTGPIYLISDRGVKFGVPDARTAAAMGLTDQKPAPDAIVRLLPDGASLNTRDAQQTYDTVKVPAGEFPSTGPQAPGSGQGQSQGQGGG